MAVRPSLVNLPVLSVTSNTLDLPSYLGYVNATPTANATYKLPVLKSYSEGAWTQIKNQSVYTITINDNDNNNIGQIPANGIGEYVSSSVGWIDYSVNPEGVIASDTNITGYLNVGSAGPPTANSSGAGNFNRLYVFDQSNPPIINEVTGTVLANGNEYRIGSKITAIASEPQTINGLTTAMFYNIGSLSFGGAVHAITSLTNDSSTAAIDITNMATRIIWNETLTSVQATSSIHAWGATIPSGITNSTNVISSVTGVKVMGLEIDGTFNGTANMIQAQQIVAIDGSTGTNNGTFSSVWGTRYATSAFSNATITNSAAIQIDTQNATAGTTNNSCIRLLGAVGGTNSRGIWFANNSTGPGFGIIWGATGDTGMWRGAVNQLLTQGDWNMRHVLCSSVPTVSAGAGAGTSPTISITGSDHGFKVTLTTGIACSTSAIIFTVTFGAAWTGGAPIITYSPANVITASIFGTANKTPYITGTSPSSTNFVANSVALSDSTLHIWNFTAMR